MSSFQATSTRARIVGGHCPRKDIRYPAVSVKYPPIGPSNDVWKRSNTLSFTTGHTCFHTMAGNPSSPGAFHDFAAQILRSTSSIVRGGMTTAARCGRGPSSSILTGSGGKNTDNSSSACSALSFVVDPSLLVSGGILSNAALPLGSRYFAACQQAQDCIANLQVNYNTSRASDLPTTLSPSDQGFCQLAHYISPGSKGRPGAQPSLTSPALFAP